MSHGIRPAPTAARILSAFALTSSYDQRSNAASIAERSDSRNNGLMSVSKVGAISLMSSLLQQSFGEHDLDQSAVRRSRLDRSRAGGRSGSIGWTSENCGGW